MEQSRDCRPQVVRHECRAGRHATGVCANHAGAPIMGVTIQVVTRPNQVLRMVVFMPSPVCRRTVRARRRWSSRAGNAALPMFCRHSVGGAVCGAARQVFCAGFTARLRVRSETVDPILLNRSRWPNPADPCSRKDRAGRRGDQPHYRKRIGWIGARARFVLPGRGGRAGFGVTGNGACNV
jgi:hypothetical protein